MAYKNLVLQGHAFANKRVARDFAAIPDFRALLNFHKSPNFHVVANFASVKICEIVDADVLPHPHSCGNKPRRCLRAVIAEIFPGPSRVQFS